MVPYLLSLGVTVVGVGRQTNSSVQQEGFLYRPCDLLNPSCVADILRDHSPDFVVHLAAINDVQISWENPATVIEQNALATLHLLDSVRMYAPQVLGVLVIGSMHEYRLSGAEAGLTEDSELRPSSPYGWSKALQTTIAQMYATLYHIPIVIARTTNLIGPGSKGVCRELATQVVAVENGYLPGTVHVGDVTVQRDFLDVRDAVTAFWQLLCADWSPGEVFHVCKGESHSIAELLWILHRYAMTGFLTTVDGTRIRPGEAQSVRFDNGKLCARTGWKPTFSLDDTLRDLLIAVRCGSEIYVGGSET